MRRKSRFMLVVVAAVAGLLTNNAFAKYVYWAELAFKIQRANVDGTGGVQLLFGIVRPRGIALDVLDGKIYWTNDRTGTIQRGNMNGSGVVDDLVTGIGTAAYEITLDLSGGKMYWTEGRSSSNKICRANLDGTNTETLYTSADGLDYPCGIALDVAHRKMYVADFGPNSILRANLDGSGHWETLVTVCCGPTDIALDLLNEKMYWSLPYAGVIQRANLDGSDVETILSRLDAYQPEGIALDLSAGKIYYTDVYRAKIQRANLDGTNVETLIPRLTAGYGPTKLAIEVENYPPIADADGP